MVNSQNPRKSKVMTLGTLPLPSKSTHCFGACFQSHQLQPRRGFRQICRASASGEQCGCLRLQTPYTESAATPDRESDSRYPADDITRSRLSDNIYRNTKSFGCNCLWEDPLPKYDFGLLNAARYRQMFLFACRTGLTESKAPLMTAWGLGAIHHVGLFGAIHPVGKQYVAEAFCSL